MRQGSPCSCGPITSAGSAGRTVDFTEDFFRPFALRYAREIRSADPRAVIFVEAGAGHWPPAIARAELSPGGLCAALV